MPPKQNQLSLLDIAGLRKQRQLYLQGNPQLDSGADMFAESGGYSKDAFADQFGMNPANTLIDTMRYQSPSDYHFEVDEYSDDSLMPIRSMDAYSNEYGLTPREAEWDKRKSRMHQDLEWRLGNEYVRHFNALQSEEYDELKSKIYRESMNQSPTDRLQARISSKLWHDNRVDW